MPRFSASRAASRRVPARGERRRHGHAGHVRRRRARRTAMAATSAESMPPDRPITTWREAVLGDVVARAEHERAVDLLHGLEQPRPRATGSCGLLARRAAAAARCARRRRARSAASPSAAASRAGARGRPRRGRGRRPRRSSSKAGRAPTHSPFSLKTKDWPSKISSSWPPTVLTKARHDEVVGGARGQHLLAELRLARVVRRGVDGDDQLGARRAPGASSGPSGTRCPRRC